jgi:DNA-binding transcriptional MerR regulator
VHYFRVGRHPPIIGVAAAKKVLTLECVQESILSAMDSPTRKSLRSGALARATGLSPDSIRHYEKLGILPQALRTEAGYRLYSADSVMRVQVAQKALRLGFSLAELSEIFRARDAGQVPCKRVLGLAQKKLKQTKMDIQELRKTEVFLNEILVDWEGRMKRSGPNQRAMLLCSLAELPPNHLAVTKKHKFTKTQKEKT